MTDVVTDEDGEPVEVSFTTDAELEAVYVKAGQDVESVSFADGTVESPDERAISFIAFCVDTADEDDDDDADEPADAPAEGGDDDADESDDADAGDDADEGEEADDTDQGDADEGRAGSPGLGDVASEPCQELAELDELAKVEFDGDAVSGEDGEVEVTDVVTDEDGEPVEVSFTTDAELEAVYVKAGQDVESVSFADGTVESPDERAISFIAFCVDTADEDDDEDGDEQADDGDEQADDGDDANDGDDADDGDADEPVDAPADDSDDAPADDSDDAPADAPADDEQADDEQADDEQVGDDQQSTDDEVTDTDDTVQETVVLNVAMEREDDVGGVVDTAAADELPRTGGVPLAPAALAVALIGLGALVLRRSRSAVA